MNYIMYISYNVKIYYAQVCQCNVPSTKSSMIMTRRNGSYTLASNRLIFQNVLMVEGLAVLTELFVVSCTQGSFERPA